MNNLPAINLVANHSFEDWDGVDFAISWTRVPTGTGYAQRLGAGNRCETGVASMALGTVALGDECYLESTPFRVVPGSGLTMRFAESALATQLIEPPVGLSAYLYDLTANVSVDAAGDFVPGLVAWFQNGPNKSSDITSAGFASHRIHARVPPTFDPTDLWVAAFRIVNSVIAPSMIILDTVRVFVSGIPLVGRPVQDWSSSIVGTVI